MGFPWVFTWKKIGFLLGKQAGDVLEVDGKNKSSIFGHWLKVKVLVDVAKPLVLGCWLNIAGGQRV